MNEVETTRSALEVLECDLRKATEELFAAYDVAGEYADAQPAALPPHRGPSVVAVIGYASERMRGALAMMATPETIFSWQPGLDASDPGVAEDMIAEFSNMLLGRLKYKLLARGVTLLVATPTTAAGDNMTLRPPPAGLVSRWHRFGSPSGTIAVRLPATFDPAFSFDRRLSAVAPAAAGEMMLF